MTVVEAPLQLARADIGERERELVLEVLDSNILALGPMTRRFEEAFAAFCGTRHAVAVSSGTAGLHLATRLAGVGPGDEVITSPISFVASANAVLYQNAVPVFADVDERTFNIDPAAVEALITPRTRAILPVHIFGYPCALEPLQAIADRHGLAIVEDACEALGAIHAGRRLAGFGNPAVFGFYPNKQMTTGEGGMVTTDDDELAAQVRALANQGRSDAGDWLEHDRLGFNYRMDELSAAVGLGQTERLPELLAEPGGGRGALRRAARGHPRRRASLRGHRDRRALVVRLRDPARARDRPHGADGAPARARRALQAVPAGDPPAAVLPRARPRPGRAADRRGDRRDDGRRPVLRHDDRRAAGARRRDAPSGSRERLRSSNGMSVVLPGGSPAKPRSPFAEPDPGHHDAHRAGCGSPAV